jgi:hypothetical protein
MGISSFFKKLFNNEEETVSVVEENTAEPVELEIDEEDRLVVALAASIMAGKDKPNSHYHISNIKRIK